jgi:hypothetical protein
LQGSENLSMEQYLKRLDEMANQVKVETQRHFYIFHDHPEGYRNSEGYFRMLYLFTVLQQDFGVHYNPERITPVGVFEPNEVFFADSRDVFIHGLIDARRRMGTCASLPVLYVAVGRRLDYPLKLVPTKNHLFIRWEDGRERFNIDGTAMGMNVYDDAKYREFPFPVSDEEIKEFGYLKSMTPAEELQAFLAQRGHCLLAMGKLDEGIAAHESALRFAPDKREEQLILADMKQEVAMRRTQASFARVVEMEQLNRQRPRQSPVLPPEPEGLPKTVIPDPNPLKQMQNQFNSP